MVAVVLCWRVCRTALRSGLRWKLAAPCVLWALLGLIYVGSPGRRSLLAPARLVPLGMAGWAWGAGSALAVNRPSSPLYSWHIVFCLAKLFWFLFVFFLSDEVPWKLNCEVDGQTSPVQRPARS